MAEATIQPEALPELAAAHVFQGFNVFSGQAGQMGFSGQFGQFLQVLISRSRRITGAQAASSGEL